MFKPITTKIGQLLNPFAVLAALAAYLMACWGDSKESNSSKADAEQLDVEIVASRLIRTKGN